MDNADYFYSKFTKESYLRLEKKGVILAKSLQLRLIELRVLTATEEQIYLEDLLQILPIIDQHVHISMYYNQSNKIASITLQNSLKNQEIRAESNSFVNAIAIFIIQAIERGFVKISWESLLKDGMQTTEYYCQSNLLKEKNWILDSKFNLAS